MTAPVRSGSDFFAVARPDLPLQREGSERERQLAWQRAMEQAASASWLHGASVPSNRRADRAQARATAPVEEAVDSPRPRAADAAVRPAPPLARAAPAPAIVDVGFAPAREVHAVVLVADATPAGRTAADPWIEAPRAPPMPPPLARSAGSRAAHAEVADEVRSAVVAALPAAVRGALRLHAEWSDQGVRLWIGVDRDDALARASALLETVRRALSARGLRLLAFVCNGRVLWGAPALSVPSFPAASEELP